MCQQWDDDCNILQLTIILGYDFSGGWRLKPASSSVWSLGTNSPVVEPMLFIVGLICKLYSWLKIPEAHVIFLVLILPSKPKAIKVSKIFLVCLLPNLRKMLWIPVVSFSVHTAMGLRQQQQMITTWCLHRIQFRVKTWYGPNQWTVCTCEYMIGCVGRNFGGSLHLYYLLSPSISKNLCTVDTSKTSDTLW